MSAACSACLETLKKEVRLIIGKLGKNHFSHLAVSFFRNGNRYVIFHGKGKPLYRLDMPAVD